MLIQQLQGGASIALISDAGTPLICDPGYHLVLAAHTAGLQVIPISGPSALISALSAAGFSSEKFIFEGYLPARKIARQQRLQLLKDETRTLVIYEVPHRIFASIEAMITCFGGGRQAVIAKEITKLHEKIRRGTLAELMQWLHSDKDLSKGEFVIVIQGAKEISLDELEARRILKILLADRTFKEAIRLTSEITRGKKNDIYKLAMALKKDEH